jgi:hypothetical protein
MVIKISPTWLSGKLDEVELAREAVNLAGAVEL